MGGSVGGVFGFYFILGGFGGFLEGGGVGLGFVGWEVVIR